MNEPLIILCDEDGQPVRRFVDGDASPGAGAARHLSSGTGFPAPDMTQAALRLTAALGLAAAALTKVGLRLARRR